MASDENKRGIVSAIMDFCKIRITFAVTITTAIGYLLSKGYLDFESVYSIVGVFILSCGSSALNQFQEVEFDSLMDRTLERPLVNGQISRVQGIVIILILLGVGLYILGAYTNDVAFVLGIFAVIWYNVIYTPMKRVTSLAVVPGALIGSIPPAIGWVAAGGDLFDPKNIVLAIFIFIWQMPHFWLLLVLYENDYRKGGYPILTDLIDRLQLLRVTYSWIVSLAVSSFLLVLFGLIVSPITVVLLILLCVWALIKMKKLLDEPDNRQNIRKTFFVLNNYVLTILVLLSFDRLLN